MRKNFVTLGVLSASVASVCGTGCLEVRGGLAREEDTGGSGDTSGVDATTPPDTDLCAGKSCDDGNPCNEDHCDPATGTCGHSATAALPSEPYECTTAANCNDNNPCTDDVCNIPCAFDACGALQCASGGSCTHASNPECVVGCANGCDDGNPCTDDACDGDACEHAVLAECDPQCTSAGLVPVHDAWLLPWGNFVKALGTVQMGRDAACWYDVVCDCSGLPVLEGYMSELGLYPTAQDESSMFCRAHGAPLQVSCEPMAVGVDYRVWGTGGGRGPSGVARLPERSERPEGSERPAPPPRIEGIAVEGFCLDTLDLALIGRYQMYVERWGTVTMLNAEISIDEPGWLYLHVQGAICQNCPTIDTWSVLEVLDNGVRFKFDATFDDLERPVVVRLASVANALTGRWVLENYAAGPAFTLHGPAAGDGTSSARSGASDTLPEGGAGMQDPYYAGGMMRLVRAPGDNPRSPCE